MERATNSALMRIKNEKLILSRIHKGPVSRADIAKETGLTKAAVTIIVDDLKQRDMIVEQNTPSNAVGRNPVMLYLKSDAFYFAGINISRHHIAVGITDLFGKVIAQDIFSVCPPPVAFEKIEALLKKQILHKRLDRSKIHKIAVVTPGPVDAGKGVILNPPNFKEWHNVAVAYELKDRTGLDVVLENVSAATAIAEKYFGAALHTENFLTLQVDEGIGSGIVIHDALFKGPCELGHTSIKYDGIQCACGNRGCLEKYAAIPNVLEGTVHKTWKSVVDSGDAPVLDREAEYLSTAIISANNIFHFDKVVLCGDLTYKPKKIIDLLIKKTEKKMLSNNSFEICASRVEDKCLIAAAAAIYDLLT